MFLLIIVYVYRAFFMAGSQNEESADTNSSAGLEQKLNQILEQQKSRTSVAANSASGNSSAKNAISEQEVDKLKLEIYNLRQQLNDAQNNAGNSSVNKSQVSEASASGESENSISPEIAKANEAMVVKVQELESRLAEYEIIADDIAELSQLRSDNTKLKEQLSQLQSANAQTSKMQSPEVKEEQNAETSPIIASSAAPIEAAVDLSGQAMVDALFAEANADVASAESAVPDSDQNLLDEFEKITQKKGNE